jgi:hypothetical protein
MDAFSTDVVETGLLLTRGGEFTLQRHQLLLPLVQQCTKRIGVFALLRFEFQQITDNRPQPSLEVVVAGPVL